MLLTYLEPLIAFLKVTVAALRIFGYFYNNHGCRLAEAATIRENAISSRDSGDSSISEEASTISGDISSISMFDETMRNLFRCIRSIRGIFKVGFNLNRLLTAAHFLI